MHTRPRQITQFEGLGGSPPNIVGFGSLASDLTGEEMLCISISWAGHFARLGHALRDKLQDNDVDLFRVRSAQKMRAVLYLHQLSIRRSCKHLDLFRGISY